MLNFLKTLSIRYLVVLGALCVVAAVVNNLRVPQEKQVEWIGGQEVLEKPQ
ncbi:hypothetical protein AGMMS49938_03470 [Fibrobacterales bacterium]|nr:hypothetical protein AGMMS49938_03470 [Fibrobacterales bacterium]